MKNYNYRVTLREMEEEIDAEFLTAYLNEHGQKGYRLHSIFPSSQTTGHHAKNEAENRAPLSKKFLTEVLVILEREEEEE